MNSPWSIAVGGDFVYDGTTGKKPFGTDLVNRYIDRVTKAGQQDDKVVIRVAETWHSCAALSRSWRPRSRCGSERRRRVGSRPVDGLSC